MSITATGELLMMNWFKRWILDEIVDRVTSWETTIAAGIVAYVTVLLTHSGIFSPDDVHSLAGQTAQWIAAGISLVLLALKDASKSSPTDNMPTPGPEKDQ